MIRKGTRVISKLCTVMSGTVLRIYKGGKTAELEITDRNLEKRIILIDLDYWVEAGNENQESGK